MVSPDSHRISRVPCYLGSVNLPFLYFAYGTFTLFGISSQIFLLYFNFQRISRSSAMTVPLPHNDNGCFLLHHHGLGSSPFARHYSGNLFDFFSSSYYDVSLRWVRLHFWLFWVFPFGYPRFFDRLLLPLAFRSLPRPSSPSVSQASPVCPYYFGHL